MSGGGLIGPAALRPLTAASTIALLGSQCPISMRWRQSNNEQTNRQTWTSPLHKTASLRRKLNKPVKHSIQFLVVSCNPVHCIGVCWLFLVDHESVRDGGSAQPARRHLLLHPANSAHSCQCLAVHLRRCPLLKVAVIRTWRLGNHRTYVAVHIPRRRLLRLVSGALVTLLSYYYVPQQHVACYPSTHPSMFISDRSP